MDRLRPPSPALRFDVAWTDPEGVVAMVAGIIFIVVALSFAVLAIMLEAGVRLPRLHRSDKPANPPVVGWGSDSRLPRL